MGKRGVGDGIVTGNGKNPRVGSIFDGRNPGEILQVFVALIDVRDAGGFQGIDIGGCVLDLAVASAVSGIQGCFDRVHGADGLVEGRVYVSSLAVLHVVFTGHCVAQPEPGSIFDG